MVVLLRTETDSSKLKKSPRFPSFCYCCGVDIHFATECVNEPNVPFVEEKAAARRKFLADLN